MLQKLNDFKYYFVVLLIGLAAGWLLKSQSLPAKVETAVVATADSAAKASVQADSDKAAAAATKKTSTLKKNADGSSEETHTEESILLNHETVHLAESSESQNHSTYEMQQTVQNNLFGVYLLGNYDLFDKEFQYAGFLTYGNWAAFLNTDQTWLIRNVGVGYGFRF